MRFRKLLPEQDEKSERSYVMICVSGDEVMASLDELAQKEHLKASSFTAIGAFSQALLGFYDIKEKNYRNIIVEEQSEVLSIVGDITLSPNDEPMVHAHVVIGLPDGATRGGHLLRATVWPTLEIVIHEAPVHLRRSHDPISGLALIDLVES